MSKIHRLSLKKLTPTTRRPWAARGFRSAAQRRGHSAHIQSEEKTRWIALTSILGWIHGDRYSGKAREAAHRVDTGTDGADPQWWEHVGIALARRYVPACHQGPAERKKHGAPREWTDERRAQLIADIECLQILREIDQGNLQDLPRLRGYSARWGRKPVRLCA
jgi:hypothetical protein